MTPPIEDEPSDEISWRKRYDVTWDLVRNIVAMPDRKLRTFLALVEDNGGRLSKNKRALFDELTDDELRRMEATVQEHLLQRKPG